MTLLSIREQNIERNNAFLLSMGFGHLEPELSEAAIKNLNENSINVVEKLTGHELDVYVDEEYDKSEDAIQALSACFPHREDVIITIVGYLDSVRRLL